MKEVEVLYPCYNEIGEAKRILNQFIYHGEKRMIDRYYYDPKRPDLKPDSNGKIVNCLRLRTSGDKTHMAYKNDHYELEEWIYSDEHETVVGSAEEMLIILKKIGLKELIIVDNRKSLFSSEKYDFVLENVKDLGVFLEVEAKSVSDSEDIKLVKEEIRKFASNLGLAIGDELNSGKPELLLKKNGFKI